MLKTEIISPINGGAKKSIKHIHMPYIQAFKNINLTVMGVQPKPNRGDMQKELEKYPPLK